MYNTCSHIRAFRACDEILAPSPLLSSLLSLSKGDLIVPLFGQKNKANGKEKKKRKIIANDEEEEDNEDELNEKQKSRTLSSPPLSRCCCCSRFSSSR
jgi:hypothetical protein